MGTGTGDRGRLNHAMFVLSLKSKMNGGVGCYLLYDLCLCSVVLFFGGGGDESFSPYYSAPLQLLIGLSIVSLW